jgi:hypothetical protein
VGRYLKQAVLRPHFQKMWINTTEKDPVLFQQQMEQVCKVYLEAPDRYAKEGVRTVSIDEMTGLQALERNAPDKASRPGSDAKQEFEYTRHGTTTLIGNLDVVSGKMFSESIGGTRTEEDFVIHIQQTVGTDPDAHWVIVLDNLNIHMSASLVKWVAKECVPDQPLGEKKKSGILKSQASRREFLSDPTHRIRFVYLPKHSSWLNQIEIVFGVIMRKVIRRGNFTSVANLEGKLRAFLAYYNTTYAHPFEWTFTGKPTAKRRPDRYCAPHRIPRRPSKIKLAKQLLV